MNFKKLKQAIKDSEFTIKEAAEKAGMTEQGLLRMFREKSMKTRNLEALCMLVKRHPSEFFEYNVYEVSEPAENYQPHPVVPEFGSSDYLPAKVPSNMYDCLSIIQELVTKLENCDKERELQEELLQLYRDRDEGNA